jgi:hypothetical protein
VSTTTEEQLPAPIAGNGNQADMVVAEERHHLWKLAQAMSTSSLVPTHFRNQASDCFIMADLASRLNVPLLPLLQGTYIVHGKPGFEGKLTAALLEGSGKIVGPIDYEFSGEGDDYGCRAVVHDRALDKTVYGPKVDWNMVKAERWDQSKGKELSKWKTLPELMFHYRAAAFLVRTRYPSVLMGMNTVDELADAAPMPMQEVDRRRSKADLLAAEIQSRDTQKPTEEPLPADVELESMRGVRLEGYAQAIEQAGMPQTLNELAETVDADDILTTDQIAGVRKLIGAKEMELAAEATA